VVLAVLLTLARPAFSAQVPLALDDPHVCVVSYRVDDAVRIYLQRGHATHVLLADDEAINTVAAGDTEGWIISAPKGSHDVFLKPKTAAHDSNLELTTNRRSYSLELVVLPDPPVREKRIAMYRVTFRYEPVERSAAERIAVTAAAKAIVDAATLERRLKAGPEVRNWNYSMQVEEGAGDITPSAAWDDGRFTYLRVSGNREVTGVYRVGSDGAESLVNFHMEGDLMVIHEVARRFVMRLGNQVIGLWNESFDVDGAPPQDGSTAPGVARTVRDGKE
jgi:type IV secretion system protein VirB9